MKSFISIFAFAAGMVFYTFTTFATKEEIKSSVIERLDRIEAKLDRALEQR